LLGALGAIGGAFFYLVLHPTELAPMVGASAAISAYTGAAARFVFQPGVFFRDDPNFYGQGQPAPPMESLREMLANRQALAFIGFWFAINLLSGVGGQSVGFSNAPIAWEAHIGGFLVGLCWPRCSTKGAKLKPLVSLRIFSNRRIFTVNDGQS